MSSNKQKESKKYEDMGGFGNIIKEAWEGQNGGVPENIALIVLFLSFLAFGSLLMLVFFLEILGNPYSLPILTGSSSEEPFIYVPFYDIALPHVIGEPSTYLSVYLILPMQFLVVHSLFPILQVQILFYLLLGLLLIVLSANLIKMKNWARIGTIIYFTVGLGYAFLTLIPILVRGLLQLTLFNVNIIVALVSIITRSPLIYGLFAFLTNLLCIILAMCIINYLGGDVKYQFERVDVETLIKDLKKGDKPSRLRAAYLLGVKGDSRAVQPLIESLGDEAWKVQERAIGSLLKIGEPAVEPLTQALESDDLDTRINAVYILGVIGDSRAVEPLIPVLGDEDWEVREEAARALGRIGDSRAEIPLRLLKKDEDKEVKRAVRIALRKIKRKQ